MEGKVKEGFFKTIWLWSLVWPFNPESLIRIINRISPNRVPWGPPPGNFFVLDDSPLYLRIIDLSLKNDMMMLRSQEGVPMSFNLVIRIEWSCLLKAFIKSTRQAKTAVGSILMN